MIINITALTAQNNGEEITVSLELSDGIHTEKQRHTILTDKYIELALKKGEIDTRKYEDIVRFANICAAYKKALSLLSYGSCSKKNLQFKLKSRGFDEDISREVIEMLQNASFVREDETCEREAERCVKKLWGKKRIISHLYSKGFDNEAVKQALLFLEQIDFEENCKVLLLKDYKRRLADAKEDRAAMTKLVAALCRMGYSISEIKSAISSIL